MRESERMILSGISGQGGKKMPTVNFVREILWPAITLQEKLKKKSPRTIEADKTNARSLERFFKGYILTDDPYYTGKRPLDAGAIIRISELRLAEVSEDTFKRELSCASKCIKVMKQTRVKYRLIPNPFAEAMNLLELRSQARIRPVSDDEMHEFISHAEQPLQDILNLLYLTGCRPCEMYNLEWHRVHLDKIVFNEGFHSDAGGQKNKTKKPISLSVSAYNIINNQPRYQDYINKDGELVELSKYVFNYIGKDDERKLLNKDAYARMVKKLKKKYPTDIMPKDFRSKFGDDALDNGAALEDVQQQYRHSQRSTTERSYTNSGSEIRANRAVSAVESKNVGCGLSTEDRK